MELFVKSHGKTDSQDLSNSPSSSSASLAISRRQLEYMQKLPAQSQKVLLQRMGALFPNEPSWKACCEELRKELKQKEEELKKKDEELKQLKDYSQALEQMFKDQAEEFQKIKDFVMATMEKITEGPKIDDLKRQHGLAE